MQIIRQIPDPIWKVMKVSVLYLNCILFFGSMAFANHSFGQSELNKKITVRAENQELRKVLLSIERKINLKFSYIPQVIQAERKISVNAENESLSEILDRVFVPLNIQYEVIGSQIVLSKKISMVPADASGNFASTAAFSVSGKVVDENNLPLPGVSINLKGSTVGTVTDAQGTYVLSLPDEDKNGTLVFSFIGYVTEEVAINSQTEINLNMVPDLQSLSEVVVIGYQTVKKKDLTGAVGIVNTSELSKLTATTLAEAMQGLATGVNVRSGGRPGQESRIEIRGIGSLGAINPFYVIDGLPGTNANRDLNPNDIESVQILKDASAAAIYGAQAANGVVIITTKKGKEGPMKVNFSAKYGIQQIPKRWDLTDNQEFKVLNTQAYANAGLAPQPGVSTNFNPAVNTDWQEEVMQTGIVEDYNLSFSGGSKNSSYFISGNYFKNKGTIIGTSFERISFRVNTEGRKGIFSIGENFAISNAKEDELEGNPFIDMVRMLPVIPVRDARNLGGFGYGSGDAVTFGTNPVALNTLRQGNNDNLRLRGNAYAEIKPLSWLRYRLNFALETSANHSKSFRALGNWTYNQAAQEAFLVESRSKPVNTQIEHLLYVNKKLEKHTVDAVFGFNHRKDRGEDIAVTKQGYDTLANGSYLPVLNQGRTVSNGGGGIGLYEVYSAFGQVNYDYAGRYFVSGTIRRDADSRFGAANKSGIFPSVAVGWRISNEEFFKVPFISDLKLRASYGKVGTVSTLSPWQYLGLVNVNSRYVLGVGDATTLFGATQIIGSDPTLRWESKTTKNVGLDVGLFGNAILITADYFQNVSKDVLAPQPVPAYTGVVDGPGRPYAAPSITSNAASLQNNGIEVSVTYRNTANAVKYDVTANITHVKNKVLSFGNLGAGKEYIQSGSTRSEVGRSLGEYYVLQTNGIFQTQEEVDEYVNSKGEKIQPYSKPGDIRYKNLNDDAQINDEDRVYAGSPWPTLQTGISGNVYYKNFSLGVQLYGSYGNKLFNTVRSVIDRFDDNSNYRRGIQPWTPENPNTDFPRIAFSSDQAIAMNTRGNTTRWLENGSYLRIRNIEIGYALPDALLKRIGFSQTRVYISGQNLLTFTKYTGLDPDVVGNGFYERGVDSGNYPANRVYSAGIQFGF